jgi:hypothetical protein
MFSTAWSVLDSRTDLTADERDTLDWVDRIWFVGNNFKPAKQPCYEQFLDLCAKYKHVLERQSKPKGGGAMRIVRWATPVHDEFPGSQWPKEPTKQMREYDITPKEMRARRRAEVRDAYRRNNLTEVERVNVDQRARITVLEQNQAAMLDLIEQMRAEVDLLKVERPVLPVYSQWLASDEVDIEQVH